MSVLKITVDYDAILTQNLEGGIPYLVSQGSYLFPPYTVIF